MQLPKIMNWEIHVCFSENKLKISSEYHNNIIYNNKKANTLSIKSKLSVKSKLTKLSIILKQKKGGRGEPKPKRDYDDRCGGSPRSTLRIATAPITRIPIATKLKAIQTLLLIVFHVLLASALHVLFGTTLLISELVTSTPTSITIIVEISR